MTQINLLNSPFSYLQTTNGKKVLLDTADAEILSQWRWYMMSSGYVARSQYFGGRSYTTILHRFLMKATDSTLVVDHINRNKLDNRKCNLRIVTRAQNSWNNPRLSTNKSGHTGVFYKNEKWRENKWAAFIIRNKESYHLGYFATKEKAIKAREDAKVRLEVWN